MSKKTKAILDMLEAILCILFLICIPIEIMLVLIGNSLTKPIFFIMMAMIFIIGFPFPLTTKDCEDK